MTFDLHIQLSGIFSQNLQIQNWCINWWELCSLAAHYFPRVFLSAYFCFACQICAHAHFFGKLKQTQAVYIKCFTNLKKEACHFSVSIIYISMFCINQFWNMAEIGHIWRYWDAGTVTISLFTSLNTRLLFSRKIVGYDAPKTSTHVNELLLPVRFNEAG